VRRESFCPDLEQVAVLLNKSSGSGEENCNGACRLFMCGEKESSLRRDVAGATSGEAGAEYGVRGARSGSTAYSGCVWIGLSEIKTGLSEMAS